MMLKITVAYQVIPNNEFRSSFLPCIDKVMLQKGQKLDEEEKKLLLEDLKSPCTEEVAVFHAFSKAIRESKRKFVVMDTAPTGHTLLLLDTAGSYHREVMRNGNIDESHIRTP